MDIFVYGTLRSRDLMAAVAGQTLGDAMPAVLAGFHVHALAGNVVPFITPAPSGEAEGLVWLGLNTEQLARLDLYEGAYGYRLQPVEVQTDVGLRQVQCYLPSDGHSKSAGDWSLKDWEDTHLTPALLAAAEVFTLEPRPDQANLKTMWPMIEARAWSKYRAHASPATRRYAPKPNDFRVVAASPPQGRFFRFQSIDIQHRTFDGKVSGTLAREAFIGIDAAVVLPYDPVRDRVLLVEQARLGPKLRDDPNPWMLEPVAGIIDARESPEDAALRETREEAGLDVTRLEAAGAFYVSPGSSTDYFYTYVGLCDLSQSDRYLGGLADEAEDLRLHPMSFGMAMDLADNGEIPTGPALFLLYWLLRHRDRLRDGG